jgi:hypothetical protein
VDFKGTLESVEFRGAFETRWILGASEKKAIQTYSNRHSDSDIWLESDSDIFKQT